MAHEWRVGSGYDLHPVEPGRPLVLGGVRIQDDFGLGGHTDGDVVLHALVDALFGAAGLPDIGEHFPDTNPDTRGCNSKILVSRALQEIRPLGWMVGNVDLTILAEKPKLSRHKIAIRDSVAELLGVESARVSVKAKTNEGFDAIGQGLAIACQVSLMLSRGAG